MSDIAVSPGELQAAAGSLGGVQGTLGCGRVQAGGFGSPELDAALDEFCASANRVADALAEAVQAASANLQAAAAGYIDADLLSMPATSKRDG